MATRSPARLIPTLLAFLLLCSLGAGVVLSRSLQGVPPGAPPATEEEARPEAFRNLDLAIFSAGGDTSRELGPEAVSRNCVVDISVNHASPAPMMLLAAAITGSTGHVRPPIQPR